MAHQGPLSSDDRTRLARLHAESLPATTLARLGTESLERYYAMVETSAAEQLFVERRAGKIMAVAVLSLEAASLLGRFVRRAPVSFSLEIAGALRRSGAFRSQLMRWGREALTARAESWKIPEVIQLFTDAAARNQHLGRAVLERVEQYLAAQSALREYMIRTLAEENEAALGFYRRRGFQPWAETRFCGERYLCMKKSIL